jgi:hypothetical protein
MPDKLRTLEKGLRMAGQGAQIDAFELSMNRAAEKAAPAASGIFKTAMPSLPFGGSQLFDVNGYVVSKSLDGLFYALGQEKRRSTRIPPCR